MGMNKGSVVRGMGWFLGIGFLVSFFTALDGWAGQSGKEIMSKHEEVRKLSSFSAHAELVSRASDGNEKKKVFQINRRLKEDGIHYQTLTRFKAPAEVKNEAILFLENNSGENEIFLYLPTYQKVRRVERRQQSGSFMGSDFSYSDLTTPHVEDYDYQLLKEEKCPDTSQIQCFLIEGRPKTESLKERTGYSKIMSWVRSDNFMIVKNENADLEGKPTKVILMSDFKQLPQGKWLTQRIEVRSLKTGGSTTLIFSKVDTDKRLDASLFTQQALLK